MEIKRKQALKMLWKDSCSIFVREEVIDEETKLTDFRDETAAVAQSAKLFLPSTCTVPAGSKIVVTRGERTFVFSRSGEPGIFTHHQEIPLEKFRGWA